jgi:hypothetical protein
VTVLLCRSCNLRYARQTLDRRLAAARLARGVPAARLLADLTASDAAPVHHLTEAVFAAQPPQLRTFRLRLAVPEQLEPGLVERLTGTPGPARQLAALGGVHAFVERWAGSPGGYRIPALLRELLTARLAYEAPDEYAALRRLCTEWPAAAALPDDAAASRGRGASPSGPTAPAHGSGRGAAVDRPRARGAPAAERRVLDRADRGRARGVHQHHPRPRAHPDPAEFGARLSKWKSAGSMPVSAAARRATWRVGTRSTCRFVSRYSQVNGMP